MNPPHASQSRPLSSSATIAHTAPPALPERPKLRALEPVWVRHNGAPHLVLRDHLQLSDRVAYIPEPLVALLAAMDGTRDYQELADTFAAQSGLLLPADVARSVALQMDEALLLDSPRLVSAMGAARSAFRAQPFRPMALAPASYPSDPVALDELLEGFCAAAGAAPTMLRASAASATGLPPRLSLFPIPPLTEIGRVAGVLSPHIDYARGGPVYAATWSAVAQAAASADAVVVFGTDHHGGPARLTPTPQGYSTPWGAFPTDTEAVSALAGAVGEETSFAEELHHTREHSIELAVVWLHWALRRAGAARLPPLLPVLCGSFYCYTRGEGAPRPEHDPVVEAAIERLARVLEGRRVLVVSAADLAHMGPAFGDPQPLGATEKASLAASDAALLAAAAGGSAAAFLDLLQQEQDRRRVCGLPPTYWALRLLERLSGAPPAGQLAGYDVCPADARAGSVVSIAGMVWQ